KWRGEEVPGALQVHGDKDRTFPIRNIKRPDKVINGVGHFMVVQRAKEVGEFIDSTAGTNT
ncbi:MAG TPA: alpha/beta hydrolase, partial [Bacteroidia bacterium]|nr:alpha/beta hydrolase [Bacteroidia bacterium]